MGFLIIGLFLSITPAVSESHLEDLYRLKTIQVLRELESLGLNEIACREAEVGLKCLSPRDLIQRLSEVQIKETEFKKPRLASRWSAFYSNSQEVIYLNTEVPHDPEVAGYLGLHELLGVFGNFDREFEITLSAHLLIHNKELRENKALRNRIEGRWKIEFAGNNLESDLDNAILLAKDGGGVIVGNGGDDLTFKLRLQVLKKILTETEANYFIPLIEVSRNDSSIRYSSDIFPDECTLGFELSGYNPLSYFYHRVIVPMNQLNEATIDEIVWFYLSIYKHPFNKNAFARHPEAQVHYWDLRDIKHHFESKKCEFEE